MREDLTLAGELDLDLADARRRLLDAGPTRVAVIHDLEVAADWNSEWSPGSRLAWGTVKAIGRGINRLAGGPKIDLKHQEAEGVLDLAGRRYTLVHSFMSQLGVAGTCWLGAPGEELSDKILDKCHMGQPDPLWFTDLLLGAHSPAPAGTGSVRGTECRHLTASVDLHRIAAASTEPVWVPERGDYRELAALPIAVWLDQAGALRRIRYLVDEHVSKSLELWDHGSLTDPVDWTRLPGEPEPGSKRQAKNEGQPHG